MIFVINCVNDYIYLPHSEHYLFHKWHLGTFAVVTDIIGILVVYYVFNKLKEINLDYQQIMDNNIIKMSDFGIRINNILLDKTTQDKRILKMKLWLHFTNILEAHRSEDNTMEVADVQISDPESQKNNLLLRMQEFQTQIIDISGKFNSGTLSYKEKANYDKLLKKLKEKIKRFKDKYDIIMEQEK